MLKVGDKFINFDGTYLTGFISPVRNVTVLPNEGGSVNAFPTTVHEGTNVSLTNTPQTNYVFGYYELNGNKVYDNEFVLKGDTTVKGHFGEVRNLTLNQVNGGTISTDKTSGIDGTTVTLSNEPINSHYSFNGYSLTGANLYDTNKFDFSGSNVTAQGSFTYSDIPYDASAQIGTQIWMTKNLDYDDGLSGIVTSSVNMNGVNKTFKYYSWNAARRVANKINGWHLPSTAEWKTLADYIGGSANAGFYLKSTSGWYGSFGTDPYGFSLYPAGQLATFAIENRFGAYAACWASNYNSYYNDYHGAWCFSSNNKLGYGSMSNQNEYLYCSVRLIKD